MAMSNFQKGALGVGAGASLMPFFNYENPADVAAPYFDKIPETMRPYYSPYMEAGNRALPQLENQFSNNLTNPSQKLNEIGGGFKQSPGFDFAMKQALQAGNHAAAAGGMMGSPQHEQQSMEMATNLSNQDYNQWLQHALNLYGTGMSGEEDLSHLGFGASNEMAQSIINALMTRGSLAFQGQNQENQNTGDIFGNIGGLASLAAFL
jgi:hypothetical protein